MPALSVVIVSYNTCQLLLDCLSSLERLRDEADFEVVVVDNASPDGTPTKVKEINDRVIIIELDGNRGFATALNAGIKAAKADVVFALNPDCIVPRGSLTRLIHIIKNHNSLGVVGCQLVGLAGDWQTSSFRFPSLFREFWNFIPEAKSFLLHIVPRFSATAHTEKSLKKCAQSTELRSVSAVSGAAFLINKQLWQELDGFDERYFLYHEEIDFCTRAIKASQAVELSEIPIIHHDAQASGFKKGHLPSLPVLGWRLSGMKLLWATHRTPFAYHCWQVLAKTMLRSRRLGILLFGFFSSKSSGDRRQRLSELAEAIEIIAQPLPPKAKSAGK